MLIQSNTRIFIARAEEKVAGQHSETTCTLYSYQEFLGESTLLMCSIR
jgi:hypothetical protein